MGGRRSSALRLVDVPGAKPAEVAGYETGGRGLDFDDVPEYLDQVARAEWERIGRVYADQPTRFREGDRVAMIAYCTYWSAFQAAVIDVAKRGVMVQGRSESDRARIVKNPALVAQREASTQLRYWARELGLTPDSRGRSGIVEPPGGGSGGGAEDNPYA